MNITEAVKALEELCNMPAGKPLGIPEWRIIGDVQKLLLGIQSASATIERALA